MSKNDPSCEQRQDWRRRLLASSLRSRIDVWGRGMLTKDKRWPGWPTKWQEWRRMPALTYRCSPGPRSDSKTERGRSHHPHPPLGFLWWQMWGRRRTRPEWSSPPRRPRGRSRPRAPRRSRQGPHDGHEMRQLSSPEEEGPHKRQGRPEWTKVGSLTQFYPLDFVQSMTMFKCLLQTYSQGLFCNLKTSVLVRHTWRCPCMSEVSEEVEGPWQALCQLKKPFKVKTNQNEGVARRNI